MANGSIAAALYPTYPAEGTRSVPFRPATPRRCSSKIPKPSNGSETRQWPSGFLLTGEAPGAITLDQLRESRTRRYRARPRPARCSPRGRATIRRRHPLPDLRRHRRAQNGDGQRIAHLVANIDMGPIVLPIGPNDRTVAFLPSAHIAQRVVVELLPIRSGMPVTFAESLMKLPQEIKAVRPTIFLAPPRLWERIYATICTELKKRPAIAQKLFYTGLGARSRCRAPSPQEASPYPARIRIPLAVIDRLAFSQSARAFRRPDACRGLRSRAARRRAGRILRSHRYAA